MTPGNPVRDGAGRVRDELERVARRWQQLPVGHALAASEGALALGQWLADTSADHEQLPRTPVPDLGPAAVVDQLRVLTYDYLAAGLDPEALADRLAALRRQLP